MRRKCHQHLKIHVHNQYNFNLNVSVCIRLYNLFLVQKYITGTFLMWCRQSSVSGLISSIFVSDVYGFLWLILCLILSHLTVMWSWHWSNNALSQMARYMEFHICMHHDYQAWLYLWPCSRDKLFFCFCGKYIY